MRTHEAIPQDWPVRPIRPDNKRALVVATDGYCGLSWDDGKVTSMTPAPSARCPFEPFHVYPKEVKWTVVGLYEDDGDGYQRWCDVIEAPTADEAALLAPEGVLVAGVFAGEMSTADTDAYA